MDTTEILIITSEKGEASVRSNKKINVTELNRALLTIPAKMYIDLFHEMQKEIYGYQSFAVANSGCGCSGTCGEPEENKE